MDDHAIAPISEFVDRLTDLPSSLIHHILCILPVKEAIRTTILSKRWNGLWANMPSLHFIESAEFGDRFGGFVTDTLGQWQGSKILGFTLIFLFEDLSRCDVIDSWLQFVMDKKVETLYLHVDRLAHVEEEEEEEEERYCVPKRIYSCSSFRKLYLISCKLETVESVKWANLRCLIIQGSNSVSEDMLNQILSGSPRLQELNLHMEKSDQHFNIRSCSLKILSVFRICRSDSASLNIWTPNLENLEIEEFVYDKCVIYAPKLKIAVLAFHEGCLWCKNYAPSSLQEQMLSKIMFSLRHVENITLSSWCTSVLLKMKMKYGELVFSMTKILQLCCAAANQVHILLLMFPQLTVLRLNKAKNLDLSALAIQTSKDDRLSPNLKRLKIVVIQWDDDDAQLFSMLEMLLGNAVVLERMEVRIISADNVPLTAMEERLTAMYKRVHLIPRCSAAALVNVTIGRFFL